MKEGFISHLYSYSFCSFPLKKVFWHFWYIFFSLQVLNSVKNNLDTYAATVSDWDKKLLLAKQYLWARESGQDPPKERSATILEGKENLQARTRTGSLLTRKCKAISYPLYLDADIDFQFFGRGGGHFLFFFLFSPLSHFTSCTSISPLVEEGWVYMSHQLLERKNNFWGQNFANLCHYFVC